MYWQLNLLAETIKQQQFNFQSQVLTQYLSYVLYILDTGVGIPDEFKANIFQPFVQADVSVSRRFGGTGLGLTISKRLAELHNGYMWFESEVGKGSTFYFTVCLPVPASFDSSPPMQFLANKRIGLLEENAQLAEILKDLMVSWELNVEVFQTAADIANATSRLNLLIIEAAQANKVKIFDVLC